MTIELVDKEDVIEEIDTKGLTEKEKKDALARQKGLKNELHYRNILSQQKGYNSQAEECKLERWGQEKQIPICIAEGTPSYKGVYKWEKYIHKFLADIFGEIEVMSYGNPGFDFRIKKSGLRIQLEVRGLHKSQYSSENTKPQWKFTHINYNKEADIFILVGVIDLDTEYPEIRRIWIFEKDTIIRGYPFWYRDSFSITDTPDLLYEYKNYELPIFKLNEIIQESIIKESNNKRNLEDIIVSSNNKIEDRKDELVDNIIKGIIKSVEYRSNELEINIVERYLSKQFGDLRRVQENVYYHWISKKDDKEIKIYHIGRKLSYAKNCDYSRYSVHIDRNSKTDYFAISLWEDGNSAMPMKVLLIHKDDIIRGEKFWNRSAITITNTPKKLVEFKRYEISI